MPDDYQNPEGREWQAPPQLASEDRRLGWLTESVQEGQAWCRNQRGYTDWRKSLDIISGGDTSSLAPAAYRSRLNANPLKRNIREVVGTLAKLKPFWGYHSDNSAYKNQAAMMNKITRAWYLEQFADLTIKEALQYAAATGRGWVHPIYRRDMAGTGHGDVVLLSYGAPCVLPNQLPASNNWQAAYVVHILDELPVYMAHGMFPKFQHRLRPSSSRYWYMNDGVRRAAQGNIGIMSRIFGRGQRGNSAEALSDLLVPMRKSYIIDLSINTSDREIQMGEPGSSWSYTVPHLKQRIRTGIDPLSGQPTWREANETDARLYPYRRLIISTDQCITYDGPAFDWHGMFPAVAFSMDQWPWEPLGFSLVHDGFEINEAIKELDRGNMDKARSQLDPALAFDQNAVAMADARRFDPMQPRARIAFDGSAMEGQPFHPAIDPQTLKIDPTALNFRQLLLESLNAQLAVTDAVALAKLRAVGSMDDLEKIMEANGPIIEELSRSMEPPIRDLGVMLKYLILQYYTTPRVMQYVGPDGVATEVFDYDPTKLVPSHIPGENPDDGPSLNSAIQRARIFADNLRFFILPGSIHEMTQMPMRLSLIQLRKIGVMIDSQTIAEAFSVPSYGTIPGNTVIERWQAEQEMQLEQAAKMQAIGAKLGLGQPPGGAAPGKAPEGRPNSNTAPPALASKDNGTRSTVTTSK